MTAHLFYMEQKILENIAYLNKRIATGIAYNFKSSQAKWLAERKELEGLLSHLRLITKESQK